MADYKIKVLFFLPPTTGGAEKITTTFARMLDKEQFEPVFVIVGRSKGDVVQYIPIGYRTIFVPAFAMIDFVWQKFYVLIKIEKPSYVFASITPINCHIIHAAKKLGVKAIVRCNCAVDRIKGRNLRQARKYYPMADLVIAQTEQMRKELIFTFGLTTDRVVTINNPIDKALISEKASDNNPFEQNHGKKYVWVGRFNEIKKVDILIKAFAKVVKTESDSKLYLIGKQESGNDYYKGILSLVKELGLEKQVVFSGFQPNPYKWINNADCLVLTSRSEASPNVVFESLYLGTPVVVSACTPDLDQIITDGNGFVVHVGDEESTAAAMLKITGEEKAELIREPANSDTIVKLFNI